MLRDWQESGAEVFIASARPERAITEYRDSLGVTSYTTLNGARTFTPHGTIDNEIATDSAIILLEKLAEIPGTVISIEATDGLYSNIYIDIWQPTVTDRLTDVAMREGVYKVLASHPDMSPEELVQTVGEERPFPTLLCPQGSTSSACSGGLRATGQRTGTAAFQTVPSTTYHFFSLLSL